MSYPCSECGGSNVGMTLSGYYCPDCGASWDFIAPANRRVAR